MDETRASIYRLLSEARRELNRTIAGMRPDEMSVCMMEDWSVKDLLAHVAFWEEIAIPDFERAARGHAPALANFDPKNVDTWNALAMSMRRRFSAEQVLFELAAMREAMIARLDYLPDTTFASGWVPAYCGISARHDRDHAKHIREWREKAGV